MLMFRWPVREDSAFDNLTVSAPWESSEGRGHREGFLREVRLFQTSAFPWQD